MPSLELTRGDAGGHFVVPVGSQIEVTLEENPGTGFRWEPVVDPQVLREVADRYEAGTDRPGAPGTRVKLFEADQPGETTLRMVKRRSWETAPTDEFLAHIEITR